jgi:uncharacterized membrane protein YphA (DoxX/SURF4 family)
MNFFFILRLLLALVFVASGLGKLFSILSFELALVNTGWFSWFSAAIVARAFSALEIALGVLLVFNTRYLAILLRFTLFLLIAFSAYLIRLWALQGNDTDCGCFGDFLPLNTGWSLFKNVVMAAVAWWLLRRLTDYKRSLWWLQIAVPLAALVLAFVLVPSKSESMYEFTGEMPYRFQMELIPKEIQQNLPVDLMEGERVVVFMSLTCPHCKDAARRIQSARTGQKFPETLFFFIGKDSLMPAFREETGMTTPYLMFQHENVFMFNEGVFPTSMYMKDGWVYQKWYGDDLNYEVLDKFKDTRAFRADSLKTLE